jgi:antitoxin HicB
MTMKKDLTYYLNLNYPIEIYKIDEEEGGGYQASINILGKYAFRGDGNTIDEAISDLEEVKKYLFERYLTEGIYIPEPDNINDKKYSGKFILRLPIELHKILSEKAKYNCTTLNQYCVYLLTYGLKFENNKKILNFPKAGSQDIKTAQNTKYQPLEPGTVLNDYKIDDDQYDEAV